MSERGEGMSRQLQRLFLTLRNKNAEFEPQDVANLLWALGALQATDAGADLIEDAVKTQKDRVMQFKKGVEGYRLEVSSTFCRLATWNKGALPPHSKLVRSLES